jgi:hypothetical protein
MARPKSLSKPVVGERGAKIGASGEPGTGKTELLMTAREIGHLLVVDAEGRTQYYDPEEHHGFEAIYSKNVKDALELLAYAEELHGKGDPVIFGVDGFSSMWFEQQEVAERIGSTSRGTAKFDSWGPAKKPLKKFYAALFATPVHCIITMRSKPKYQIDGNTPKALGYNTADVERGLPYALDLIVEMNKDELPPGQALVGDNFWALVVKTSGPKGGNPLPIGTKVKDPSFEKLMIIRLDGEPGGLQFQMGDAALQAAYATITDARQLGGLMKRWGMYTDEIRGYMREKYGSPPPPGQERVLIDALWQIKKEGLPEVTKQDG